jgi:hypothetical protein
MRSIPHPMMPFALSSWMQFDQPLNGAAAALLLSLPAHPMTLLLLHSLLLLPLSPYSMQLAVSAAATLAPPHTIGKLLKWSSTPSLPSPHDAVCSVLMDAVKLAACCCCCCYPSPPAQPMMRQTATDAASVAMPLLKLPVTSGVQQKLTCTCLSLYSSV